MEERQPVSAEKLRELAEPLVTCPLTGNSYRLCYPTTTDFINSGASPQAVINPVIKLLGMLNQEQREPTDDELKQVDEATRLMLKAAMVEPKLVDKIEGPGQVEFRHIPPTDRAHLFRWLIAGEPQRPVETADRKATTVAAVESFPAGAKRRKAAGSGSRRKARQR